MTEDTPTRVAIIGGGCAAMTAAYELSKPELDGRFDVTVYQYGWRLGGKGASGRGPNGRIEEHGLHVWMGFYENAFRLMRAVYDELDRDPSTSPIVGWRDAFFPAPHVGLADWSPATDWTFWSTRFPALPGLPGDPLAPDADNPFTLIGYLRRAAEITVSLFRSAYGPPDRSGEEASQRYLTASASDLYAICLDMSRSTIGSAATLVGWVENQLELLVAVLQKVAPTNIAGLAVPLLTAAVEVIARLRPMANKILGDDVHRKRAAEVLEVLVASQVGVLRSGVMFSANGFDKLDHLDFGDWLRLNGASDHAVNSPFVRGLYSLMFGYEDGDYTRPRAAAGQAVRGCLRMFFTYRGSFFWKMRSGMGDIVFAPLYEVLQRRGVKFEFFHKLEDIRLSPKSVRTPYVSELRFSVQAQPIGGQYQPLVDIKGVPCWPAQPDWSQLEGGERMRQEAWQLESHWDKRRVATKELTVGRDFDFVVLGVGLGAVPHVAAEIVQRDHRWQRMTRELKTVATQALQLWTHEPVKELGWQHDPITLTAFTSPFDTWADMTHLVAEEDWPDDDKPGSVAYFCNVLDERQVVAAEPTADDHPLRVHQTVEQNARRFMDQDLPTLWPAFTPASIKDEFWTGNVNPSDRYVLCLPGTPQYRISPLDRTYDNLTIAGDWTSCGLNLGCVEAAVMSGMLAAHALSGSPRLETIIGYDHP